MIEAVNAQPVPSESRTGEERRVWVRYMCNLPTSCQPVMAKDDLCWSGRVQNISRGGVNLIVPRRFEPGTLLQIELPGATEAEPRNILARVVHARTLESGSWSLGCAFPWLISDEDVTALINASDSII